MPTAHHPPCCRGRLAHNWVSGLRTALAALVLWPAAASAPLSAAESAIPSVGPASREQQRPADATRTAGDAYAGDAYEGDVYEGIIALAVMTEEWESITLCADVRTQLNELELAFEKSERVAQIPEPAGEDPIVDEQVPAGQLERDPCYVSGPITAVGVNIAPTEGAMPENVALKCKDEIASTADPRMMNGWAGFDKHWAATCFCHGPLYFQEINAERYGYTRGHCVQPFISAGHFLATIPALPYLVIAHPPCECVYTFGQYRPGSCVPWRSNRPAWCLGAGVTQAAVVVGLVALIP